jgi:hypothetical protein
MLITREHANSVVGKKKIQAACERERVERQKIATVRSGVLKDRKKSKRTNQATRRGKRAVGR